MKERNSNINPSEQQREDRQQKRPYEKPRLGTVKLFADQVLGYCRTGIGEGCTSSPLNPISIS